MKTSPTRLCLILVAFLLAGGMAFAQTADSTRLNQSQWQHALAIVAQNEALEAGYGQPTQSFADAAPNGAYTLEDLNNVYGQNSKWSEVYHRLKIIENNEGSIADIRREAGRLAPQVTKQLSAFLAKAPGEPTEPQPVPAVADSTPVIASEADTPAKPAKPSRTLDLFPLIAFLTGLIGIGIALWTFMRCRAAENALRTEINLTKNSLSKLANDLEAQTSALLTRIANMEANQRVMSPRPPQHKAQPADVTTAPANVEKKYYLSKPDENDCFTRVSDQFEPGNSLFVLTTTDNKHGEFQVIDNRDVYRFALMMPSENLLQACSGNSIQVSTGMSRIITDRPGEAHYENGQWRVVVKAIIHYES